uniref:Uncharacterized protein n=1 Tax=Sinocyclocheilus anshuiensis TaxID=1608454 RepID=A0A671RKY6_9TELE
MAERGVRSAKHLLEKCARDGSDVYAALLNLRNTPRDGLPSPAQRLLSRRTRSLIPLVPSQLTPRVESNVQAALFWRSSLQRNLQNVFLPLFLYSFDFKAWGIHSVGE